MIRIIQFLLKKNAQPSIDQMGLTEKRNHLAKEVELLNKEFSKQVRVKFIVLVK